MLLIFLVLASALLAFVAAIFALQVGLKLRRTHAALRSYLQSEVTQLAYRTTELEKNLGTLDVRAQALPVRISELQQNLSTLRILANALSTSLRQAHRLLSFPVRPFAGAFRALRNARSGSSTGLERQGDSAQS